MQSSQSSDSFILPDLATYCKFNLRINQHRSQVSTESEEWFLKGHTQDKAMRRALDGLDVGLIAAACYPDVGYAQLRACADFLLWFFFLDNISDEMDNQGTHALSDLLLNTLYHPYDIRTSARIATMAQDFYQRIMQTASPRVQHRFVESLDFFLQSINEQAHDRVTDSIPDLESYIALRRDTSGCKTCWVLIEYSNNLDIPDEVMEHPLLRSIGEAANDLVSWSNDIYSYNKEQAEGDSHNMVAVIMEQMALNVQEAITYVGDLCKESIDRFIQNRDALPSWGPQIDREVTVYVDGLASWIVGILHWSFETERYFGKSSKTVRDTHVVRLLPRKSA